MKGWLFGIGLWLAASVSFAAINLNTATKEELVALPGIGPAKAQAILDYRQEHGGFKSVDELKDVKGMGAKRFEKLRGEFTIAAPAATKAAAVKAEKSAAAPARSGRADAVAAKRDGTGGSIRP